MLLKEFLVCLGVHNICRCSFTTSTSKRDGDRAVREEGFCMLLKVNWYKFRLEYYNFRILNIIPMVTTKTVAIEYTQKKRGKELKHFAIKNELKTKDSNAGNKGTKS